MNVRHTLAILTTLATVTWGALLPALAGAQTFPTQTIRIVVPFPPGGFNDIMGRALADGLSRTMAQSVVVDNRAGAGGNIGTEYVARAPADGHTLLIGSTPLVFGSLRNQKPPFDTLKDFAPITIAVETSNILVVNKAVPARTVKELLDLLRANPGKYNYASSSLIGSSHLGMELFKYIAKLNVVHVPYSGSGTMIKDLLSNQVSLTLDNIQFLKPHVDSGTLVALAAGGLVRSDLMPNVPTLHESGFPNFESTSWVGVFAPAATPRPVMVRLHSEIAKVLATPEFIKRLPGARVVSSSSDQAVAHLHREMKVWGDLVRNVGLKLD